MRQRVSMLVEEVLDEVAVEVGCERADVLDLLLRAVGAGAVDLIRQQRIRDGAARAAWQRTRRA